MTSSSCTATATSLAVAADRLRLLALDDQRPAAAQPGCHGGCSGSPASPLCGAPFSEPSSSASFSGITLGSPGSAAPGGPAMSPMALPAMSHLGAGADAAAVMVLPTRRGGVGVSGGSGGGVKAVHGGLPLELLGPAGPDSSEEAAIRECFCEAYDMEVRHLEQHGQAAPGVAQQHEILADLLVWAEVTQKHYDSNTMSFVVSRHAGDERFQRLGRFFQLAKQRRCL